MDMKFKEIRIKGYRGLRELNISLNSINVVVGPNNTGKSAILEAMALVTLKDNDFVDTKGDNVANYLVRRKKYPIEFIVNMDADAAIIETDDLSLKIEYFPQGLPHEEAYKISGFLENKISDLIGVDTFKIARALDLFAREIKFENREVIQKAIPKVLRQLMLPEENERREIIEHTMELIVRNPKLLFTSEKTLHIFLPKPPTLEFSYKLNFVGVSSLFDRFITIDSERQKNPENVIFSFQRTGTETIQKLYGELVKRGTINSAISLIRDFVPYVLDIRMVESKEIFVLTEFLKESISINSMGDGFISLIRMIFLFGLVKDGLIILEEPEISLHPGFIDIISNVMVSNTQNNQILMSTHSIDFIENLLEVAEQQNRLDTINIIRLHRREDVHDIFAEVLSGKEALEEIEAIGTDLRST